MEQVCQECYRLVEARLSGKPVPLIHLPDSTVRVFCTWRLGSTLRGCLGALAPIPMRDVPNLAFRAAVQDARFAPMTLGEFQEANLELTFLSKLEPAENVYDWMLGRHGILLEC